MNRIGTRFDWRFVVFIKIRRAAQVLPLLDAELLRLFFFVGSGLQRLGLIETTGGSNGRAIQTSAERGGGGGSLR
jgi:hypothetical protein